jgi:two-component system alkaline phosphatase synthesis response regulator PhoP
MKPAKLCVLIAEDEPHILEHLAEELGEIYEVETATDGSRAWSKVQKIQPDLVLLDITMPGLTGFDVCRRIRASPTLRNTPVLFLTAHTLTDTVVKAFEVGADDYVEKPFRMAELKARVAAKLRDKTRGEPDAINAGSLTLRPNKMAAEVGGHDVPISALEFRLLKFFVTRPERLIAREEILSTVWKGEAISARTIDAHVVSLRKLLQKCDFEIASVYGEGYLFQLRAPKVR